MPKEMSQWQRLAICISKLTHREQCLALRLTWYQRDDILQVANHTNRKNASAKRDDDLLKPYATEMHIGNHLIQLPEGINA